MTWNSTLFQGKPEDFDPDSQDLNLSDIEGPVFEREQEMGRFSLKAAREVALASGDRYVAISTIGVCNEEPGSGPGDHIRITISSISQPAPDRGIARQREREKATA